ncbi:MAG: hypothetical protein AVDCRST_MAG67-97 [uncultured Solirubrobacteraceae bacterium]|uniref:Uncharacterized protein n=1 Tax=uncultured Solirubrobacteraceae bacterium TaxID=1162706 RepID=A0A6J4RBV5_9ACTN|nr:MAG: hypothetical protein AVDCRST_MAG67-97 [uncultured Solirubrobacteraceae bacterium]
MESVSAGQGFAAERVRTGVAAHGVRALWRRSARCCPPASAEDLSKARG